MKYHKKEKIYCLSGEDRDELWKIGKELWFDRELNNYYWFLETVEETSPDFFKVIDEDWIKIKDLGYSGQNDIREILEWIEFRYRLTYSINYYREKLIESHIVLNNTELSSFLLVSVENRDERSKYILMKKVLNSMFWLFEVKSGKVYGPDTSIFNKTFRGESEWT